MNSVIAAVLSAVASFVVILVFLWDIASSQALLHKDVAENKQILKDRTPWFTKIEMKMDELSRFDKESITVKYVNKTFMIVSVNTPEGIRYLKVPIIKQGDIENVSDNSSKESRDFGQRRSKSRQII